MLSELIKSATTFQFKASLFIAIAICVRTNRNRRIGW